jgi:hypothetical protein
MIIFTVDKKDEKPRVAVAKIPGGKPQMLISSDQISEFVGDNNRDLWISYTKEDKLRLKARMWNIAWSKVQAWMDKGHDGETFSGLFKQSDWVSLSFEELAPEVQLDDDTRNRLNQMIELIEDDDSGITDELMNRLYLVNDNGRPLVAVMDKM